MAKSRRPGRTSSITRAPAQHSTPSPSPGGGVVDQGDTTAGVSVTDDTAGRLGLPAGAAEGNLGLVYLDPKAITWPEVRITSQYRDAEADALTTSIEGIGQQQPIGVYLVDGKYIGSDGMNRCLSAIKRGETAVLCHVRQGQSADVLKSNIATALLRGHTNPLSVVETLAAAHDQEGMDIADLATASGRNVEWVERMLVISVASPAVKQALGEEIIAVGHAEALSQLEDQAEQERVLVMVLEQRWTVGELEDFLASGEAPEEKAPPAKASPRPHVCAGCHIEQEVGGVTSLLLCNGCVEKLGPGEAAAIASFNRADRDLVELLHKSFDDLAEAAHELAKSPDTASLAERIGTLIERMRETTSIGG